MDFTGDIIMLQGHVNLLRRRVCITQVRLQKYIWNKEPAALDMVGLEP